MQLGVLPKRNLQEKNLLKSLINYQNIIEWDKGESQDKALIYVDDFIKELQAKLKLL
jgi:hypothetical protein